MHFQPLGRLPGKGAVSLILHSRPDLYPRSLRFVDRVRVAIPEPTRPPSARVTSWYNPFAGYGTRNGSPSVHESQASSLSRPTFEAGFDASWSGLPAKRMPLRQGRQPSSEVTLQPWHTTGRGPIWRSLPHEQTIVVSCHFLRRSIPDRRETSCPRTQQIHPSSSGTSLPRS